MKIDTQTYQARRERLMQSLPDNSVVVLRTGELATRNNDCEYEFRPHSSFFYLTGFPEPSAYAIIHGKGEITLLTLPKDPEREQWDGFRFGSEGAIKTFGADDAAPLEELDKVAFDALNGAEQVVYLFNDDVLREKIAGWRDAIAARVRIGAAAPTRFIDLLPLVSEMRLRKDAEEIAIMETAAQISVEAHKQAMRSVRPGMNEYQLEAEIMHEFGMSGARQAAYSSIVGGGANACVLHYVENRDELKSGDLVLIDAGSDYQYYAADITRTFPVNGKFSAEQAALYQLVLDAQYAAIEATQPGNHWNQPHDATVQVITAGLVKLGLLAGDVNKLIEEEAYKPFYMHRAGHWLGMDVHDVGDYKVNNEWRVLEAGMALTVEPGIYVAVDNMDVDEKWRGIGIRIEDDVLVTKTGNEVLTEGVVKEIADIEALMAQSN